MRVTGPGDGNEGFNEDGDKICSDGAVTAPLAAWEGVVVAGTEGAGPLIGLVARRTLYEPGWTSTWRTT